MSMLDKFTVIDIIKTRSSSVCTVDKTFVKFNTQTAQELHYPPFVQLLLDAKGKQFAIRASKEDAPNAVKFSKPEGEQRYPIKVSSAAVVDAIRKLMGWSNTDVWNLPGVYFAEDNAIIYGLETAYPPNPKGGWAAKRRREAAFDTSIGDEDNGSEEVVDD